MCCPQLSGGMVGANHYSEHSNHHLTMNVSRTGAFLENFTAVLDQWLHLLLCRQERIIGSVRKKGRSGNHPLICSELLDVLLKIEPIVDIYNVRLRISTSHLGQSMTSVEQKVYFPVQTLLGNLLTC